jgi:glycosyltransferase involved in cell wall biosynthesis
MITQSSGPTYTVARLCEAQAACGAQVELHLVGEAPAGLDPRVEVHTYPQDSLLRPFCLSGAMKRGLATAAKRADVLHNHSLWLMPNIYPGAAVRGAGGRCRLVVSPRGTLSEWAMSQSRWKKAIVWRLLQRPVVAMADLIHATAESELDDVRRCGFSPPVAVLPNGIDAPAALPLRAKSGPRTLLFLSRIHPTKGVQHLLEAWAAVESKFPDWRLRIAGPLGGEYPCRMQDLAGSLGLARVDFAGELSGAAKSEAFAKADLFVLPSQSENFGIAVAEALAHGTPAIVSRGAPWAGLESHGCGWWIDRGPEALRCQLEKSMPMAPERLHEMGDSGRQWMLEKFSWPRVSARMLETYDWLLGREERPGWIHG